MSYALEKRNRKITLFQLERICGFLNFLSRAIVPGRAFTRRLYSVINPKLKPHHHIRLSAKIRKDLMLWKSFLQHPTAFYRPFMDFSKLWIADEVEFFMDASKNFRLGFGGYCQNSWMIGSWQETKKRNASLGP